MYLTYLDKNFYIQLVSDLLNKFTEAICFDQSS